LRQIEDELTSRYCEPSLTRKTGSQLHYEATMKKTRKSSEKRREHIGQRQRDPNNKESSDRSSSRLNAALKYAEAGLPVVPLHSEKMGGGCSCGNAHCDNPGMHPRTKVGVRGATTNRALIEKYWTKWPHANIGMPMGKGSGFLALVSEGSAGEKALRELEEKA
jgi:hypothetical protein